MGTIRIEEYTTVGGAGAVDGAPVANLSAYLATTVDATTSTTAESVTLNPDTRFVTVSAVEDHRVTVKSTDGSAQYGFIPAGQTRDYAINKNDRTLYYKADA